LQIELAEKKSQSLHSQKSAVSTANLRQARKNSYSECYKIILCLGPKSARNILSNLSPNPARPEKPGSTYNSGLVASCVYWIVSIAMCEWGERTCSCL